jgi:surfeit locus 1 family protein
MTQTKSPSGQAFWIAVAVAFSILVGLGTWQMQRRAWKLSLIDRIESRAHGEPISLTSAKELWQKSGDVEYYRVLLVGRLLHDEERHLYTVEHGKAGWRVLTPLQTGGGDLVFVDRGYVPEELKEPGARKAGQVEGIVEMIGLARAPITPGLFTPEASPARNQWFVRDTGALAASLPSGQGLRVVPFVVEAEAEPVPGGWPRGGVTRLTLTNRHLEYAITWYGLALTLLGVAFAMTRARSREVARQL